MADGQVVFEIKGDSTNVDQTVKKVTSNIESESKKWDQAASQATGDIEKSFASMAGNSTNRHIRNIAIRDNYRINNLIGQSPKTGA